ncbi:MAG TPA: GDYXXLXY domain-containing protein [Virgibacillus sp.]|nr:GDYXXLXY domain-containing protein [Virgibacillus sp.]
MKLRTIQTSYLLGISLILTGIFYFFAANWGYFDRIAKVSLSISLLILFYLIHFLLKRLINYRPFLSNWSLFAASIVFGVAVALIGQIYNSHADSYQLFLVWLIPVLALAFITRYIPFYVLAFILANLTMLFFVFPSSYMPVWSPPILFSFLMMIGITNAGIFYMTYKHWIKSKTILYLAYIMTFGLFFNIAVDNSMPFHELFNVFYGFLLLLAGYFFLKEKQNKGLFTVTIIFAAFFLIYRVFYWALSQSGDWILYVLLFFAAILTLISIVVVGVLNKNKMNRFLSNVLIVVIAMIATLFATVAITGIFFLLFPEGTVDALFFVAILALLGPGLLMKLMPQIRYTLLGTGFVIGYATALFSGQVLYEYILLILLCAGIYIVQTKGIKVLLYLFANVVVYIILIQNFSFHVIFLAMFAFNLVYYIFQRKEQSTNYTAFVLVLLSFMALTFLDLQTWLQVIYNLIFLMSVSMIILSIDRKCHRFEWTVSFVLWFVFIGYNYYEYLWTLIHKSIAAIIVGIIFIWIATYFERRTSEQRESKAVSYRKPLLIILILMQIGFIGIQSFTSEKLLSEGDLIKLELQPVDPRSLLQGDYIILNYKVNDLQVEEAAWNKKVKVLLREKNGIYEYAGNYQMDREWHKDYEEQPGDVIINGLMHGNHSIIYGIESYFVPEGTGRELETSAKYAYVRVSESGNALLEKVE